MVDLTSHISDILSCLTELLILHVDDSLSFLEFQDKALVLGFESRLLALFLSDDLDGLDVLPLLVLKGLSESLDLKLVALVLRAH